MKGNYAVFWTIVMLIEPPYGHWTIVTQRILKPKYYS